LDLNPGAPALSDLRLRVTTLTNGNLLQNADAGPSGVGAELTLPRTGAYSDGILNAGESIDVPFTVCLRDFNLFSFVVDAFGSGRDN
jgi:hypothetical protein